MTHGNIALDIVFKGPGRLWSKSMRKLLVSDIDGTLAHRDHVPDGVVRACEALRAEGWDIALATGRILASAMKYVRAVGGVDPVIVYDGARVMCSTTGEEIWGKKLPAFVVEEILEKLWRSNGGIQVFGDEIVFCRKGDEMARKYFAALGVPVDDSLDRPRTIENVYRIIIFGDPHEIRILERRMSGIFEDRARAVLAGEGFLDILPPGVSKGSALGKLIGSMHEDERPVIIAAAGDNMNDLELLNLADIAVTMSDADLSLLEVADIIIPPAREHGFSEIFQPLEEAAAVLQCAAASLVNDRPKVQKSLLGIQAKT